MNRRRSFRAARTALGLLLLVGAAPAIRAQSTAPTGRIVGRVVDAATGQGISDAGVQIVGTTAGTMSGLEGRFALAAVPAGTVTIQVRRIGYAPKTVTGLMLAPGQTLEQSVSLASAAVSLSAQVVTASAERGSVSEALDRQRNAPNIVNAVTSEQISRGPDSDAAQAVQRVSGVTVTEGKFVQVRGLGDRYTTASLNGARIPSPEPERKVVPLDLFPSGLIQSVTTSKTFTPDQQGDFSGAQVDITTREFPARRRLTYSASIGANTAAAGSDVLRAPMAGTEWLGFAGGHRNLPIPVEAAGNFGTLAPSAGSNGLIRSFRNAWTPTAAEGTPNYSSSMSLGGQDPVLGQPIGYIASLSYSTTQEVRADERVAASLPDESSESGIRPVNEFRGSTGRQSVLWGGLLNLSTLVGGKHRISLNNTYTRTSDSEARQDEGIYEPLARTLRRSTLRFVERSVRSNQLRGQHALGGASQLDWSVTSASVARREPDRSDLAYARDQDASTGTELPFALLEQSLGSSRRTFGDLEEQNVVGEASYRMAFGAAERQRAVKVGAFVRSTNRDAVNGQYNIQLRPNALSAAQRQARAEEIFDGRFAEDPSRVFNLQQLSAGGSYDASDRVLAGFAMTELPITSRLRLVGGARLERTDIEVRTEPTAGADTTATIQTTDILPSLALNLRVTETQNLRLSASQTLARPEYRELSPVTFFEVIGGGVKQGNPNLERTLIQNVDARWEWYPSAGEILSVGVFAKHFDRPIEAVDRSTSGEPFVTWVNAERAVNYGVELEARKGLGFVADRLAGLDAFVNTTLMRSEITVGNDSIVSNTHGARPMVGQAPYVVNGGVTWTNESGRASGTVLFNRVGRRIVAAGVGVLPDNYEQPRNVLDLSMRLPVTASIAARLDARNVLDAPFVIRQGSVVRERYTSGSVLSAGLSWQP